MPKFFKSPVAALFIFVGLLYLKCAPTTVQNLDSGEMVANSYGLFVIHPPGYPLFTWMMFLATHIPIGSVFFRASAFTILCSLATLWLVDRIGPREVKASTQWVSTAMVLALAFTPVYWRYSMIPDVFMMNLFFCASLSYVFLTWPTSAKRLWTLSILFGLASANHQSIIFCLPMLLHAAWQVRPFKRAVLPLTAGAALTVILYLTLLLLHTASLNSWKHLQTLDDLWAHFLRTDFGTFQISGHNESSFGWEPLAKFALAFLQSNPLTLALIAVGFFFNRSRDKKIWTVGLCAALSLFAMIPFATLDNVDVLERFFLMPTLLCVILGITIWHKIAPSSRAVCGTLAAFAIAASVLNTLPVLNTLDYARDTVIEDYAQNLMRMIQDKPRTIFLTQGDSRLFSTRYVQVVQGIGRNAIVIPVGMAFDDDQLAKIKNQFPDFKVDADWNQGPGARSIPDHLLTPNLPQFNVFTDLHLSYPNMQVVLMGVGRLLRQGHGETVDEGSLALIQRRTTMTTRRSMAENERKDFYADYALPYLALGLRSKNPRPSFQKALDIVPYCWPALENICLLNERATGHADKDCRARLQTLRTEEFNYFR